MEIKKYRTRFSLISSGKNSEEKQIFLVTTIEGVEVFYYSGYRVHSDNFIKETIKRASGSIYIQEVKKNTFNKAGDPASAINSRLRELENASLLVFDKYFKGRDIEFSKEEFKKQLQIELNEYDFSKEGSDRLGFFGYYEKYKDEAKVTEGRRRHYVSDIKRLKGYEKHIGSSVDFDTLDILDYNKFVTTGRSSNTVVAIMKRLKSFYIHCKSEGIINDNPFDRINFALKIGSELYEEPVCMTRDELTRLYESKMPDFHHERVRDMFCLQAAFGCRVSDFIRLTYDNIQDGQLVYFPEKTRGQAQKVIVPMSNRAVGIIRKHKGKGRNGLIMPFINAVEYNKILKEVFKIAKINRTIVQFDRDKGEEVYQKLHEIASSHLARRTFVDILCQAGEPIHVVASMSGHSENSKAFDRYRRRPEQLQKVAVSRSMD